MKRIRLLKDNFDCKVGDTGIETEPPKKLENSEKGDYIWGDEWKSFIMDKGGKIDGAFIEGKDFEYIK